MTDLIDTANDKAQAFINESVNAVCQLTVPNSITECIDCENDIGAARKAAVPFAIRCIKCQTLFEQGKKR